MLMMISAPACSIRTQKRWYEIKKTIIKPTTMRNPPRTTRGTPGHGQYVNRVVNFFYLIERKNIGLNRPGLNIGFQLRGWFHGYDLVNLLKHPERDILFWWNNSQLDGWSHCIIFLQHARQTPCLPSANQSITGSKCHCANFPVGGRIYDYRLDIRCCIVTGLVETKIVKGKRMINQQRPCFCTWSFLIKLKSER